MAEALITRRGGGVKLTDTTILTCQQATYRPEFERTVKPGDFIRSYTSGSNVFEWGNDKRIDFQLASYVHTHASLFKLDKDRVLMLHNPQGKAGFVYSILTINRSAKTIAKSTDTVIVTDGIFGGGLTTTSIRISNDTFVIFYMSTTPVKYSTVARIIKLDSIFNVSYVSDPYSIGASSVFGSEALNFISALYVGSGRVLVVGCPYADATLGGQKGNRYITLQIGQTSITMLRAGGLLALSDDVFIGSTLLPGYKDDSAFLYLDLPASGGLPVRRAYSLTINLSGSVNWITPYVLPYDGVSFKVFKASISAIYAVYSTSGTISILQLTMDDSGFTGSPYRTYLSTSGIIVNDAATTHNNNTPLPVISYDSYGRLVLPNIKGLPPSMMSMDFMPIVQNSRFVIMVAMEENEVFIVCTESNRSTFHAYLRTLEPPKAFSSNSITSYEATTAGGILGIAKTGKYSGVLFDVLVPKTVD